MPNYFAYAVLLLWPVMAIFIASKFKASQAAVLLLLIPYLLLPLKTTIPLPLIDLSKENVPPLVAFFLLFRRHHNFRFLPTSNVGKLFVILLWLAPILTTLANGDTLYYGAVVKRGIPLTDTPGMLIAVFVTLIPFLIGFNFLSDEQSHKDLLKYLVIAGLIYSIPILWEIKMSPRLHSIIYGVFPHDWRQQIRQGGFRPVVFLGHGLYVAAFMLLSVISASVLWKQKEKPVDKTGVLIPLYLLAIVVLSKSLSVLIYAVIAAWAIFFLGKMRRIQLIFMIALFVFIFPMVRSLDLIPTEKLTGWISQYSEERAGSLQYRFDNEDMLLAKANERPLFGWGSYGRNRVFDPYTGRDISTTDGTWILFFGKQGWVGYIAFFGLLCYPIFAMYRVAKRGGYISPFSIGIGIALSLNLLDLIPNSSLSHLTLLMTGALLGYVEANRKRSQHGNKTGADQLSASNSSPS
ncbi:O-antigen ligase family protein [Gynuella sp.]|uniref:O-antigen ligase family protein n=1 Tax=Gynuella sp. TaxID=2969146 RepID=UPI003D0BF6BA